MEERKAGRKIVMRFTAALMTFVMFCVLFAPTEVHAARKPKLNKTKIMIAVGDKTQLKMTGTTKKVVWKSSNKRVATVTAKGVVKAKKAGKATITAKHKGKTYKCKVTVVKPSISRKTLALNVGRTAKLTIRGAMSKVQWSSSNPRVAKVGKTSGKVTAVGAGKATIKGKFLGKTYKCVVTVKDNTSTPTPNPEPTVTYADELSAENARYQAALTELDNEYDSTIDSYKRLAGNIWAEGEYYTGSYSSYQRKVSSIQEEISSKEIEIAYLRRDTSSANQLRIMRLESEVDALRKEYSDLVVSWSRRQSLDQYVNTYEDLENEKAMKKYTIDEEHKKNVEALEIKYGI